MADSSSSADCPQLKPLGQHADKPAIRIHRPVFMIGSRHSAHLHLLSRQVGKAHALILKDDQGIYLRDLCSRTHVYVNSQPVIEAWLNDGDQIKIGSFTFRLLGNGFDKGEPRLLPPGRIDVAGRSKPVLLEERVLLIGRREGCDLQLDDSSISTEHAVVFAMGGAWYLRDLGSRTGTFLNDQQIHQKPLSAGDSIRIGPTEMRFEPSLEAPAEVAAEVDELDQLVAAGLDDEVDPIAIETPEPEPVEAEPAAEATTEVAAPEPASPGTVSETAESDQALDDLLAMGELEIDSVESVGSSESIKPEQPTPEVESASPEPLAESSVSPADEAIPLASDDEPPTAITPTPAPTEVDNHADQVALDEEDASDALLVDADLESHRLSSSATHATPQPAAPDDVALEGETEPSAATPLEHPPTLTQALPEIAESAPSAAEDAAPPSESDFEPLPRRGWRRLLADQSQQSPAPPAKPAPDSSAISMEGVVDPVSQSVDADEEVSAPLVPPVVEMPEEIDALAAFAPADEAEAMPAEVKEKETPELAASPDDGDFNLDLPSLDEITDELMPETEPSPASAENEIKLEPLVEAPSASKVDQPFDLTLPSDAVKQQDDEPPVSTEAAASDPILSPELAEVELLQPDVAQATPVEEINLPPLDLALDEPEPLDADASRESSAGEFDFSNLKLDSSEESAAPDSEADDLGLDIGGAASIQPPPQMPIAAASSPESTAESQDLGLELEETSQEVPTPTQITPEPLAANEEPMVSESDANEPDLLSLDALGDVLAEPEESVESASADTEPIATGVEPAATEPPPVAAAPAEEVAPPASPERRSRRSMPLRGPDGKFIKRRKSEEKTPSPQAAKEETAAKSAGETIDDSELENSADEVADAVSEISEDAVTEVASKSETQDASDAVSVESAQSSEAAPESTKSADDETPVPVAAAPEPAKEPDRPSRGDPRSLMGLGTNIGGFFGGIPVGFEKESPVQGSVEPPAPNPSAPRMRHPFDWDAQSATVGGRQEIPPFQEPRPKTRGTNFDALAMPPVLETDVFSQMPAAKMQEALLNGEVADSQPGEIPLESITGGKPPSRRATPPQNPWPAAPPPPPPPPPAAPRRRWFGMGMLLGLMLLCMAAAAGGIWQFVHPQSLVQGVLPFEGPQPTIYQQHQQAQLLNDPHVRQAARKILQEEHIDGGFLNDDRVYKQFAANVQWSADGLLLSRTSNDLGGDQKRIAALLTALYRSPENQAMIDHQANLTRQVEDLRTKESEAKDALRDLDRQIKAMEDNPPPVPTSAEQAAVAQQLIDLKKAWETGTPIPSKVAQENWLVAPQMQMLESALAQARAASPSKDAEAQAAYLQTLVRQQKMQSQLADAQKYQHQLQEKRQHRRAAQSAVQLATQNRVGAQEKFAAALAPRSPALPSAIPLQDPRPTYITMCLGGIALVFMFLILLTLLVGRDTASTAWQRPQPAPRPYPKAEPAEEHPEHAVVEI